METWEQILIGAVALIMLFLVVPGLKSMFARSKEAPKDWMGLLLPIGLVVMFVLFLISTL